jgi:hypothetical protein
LTSKTLKVLSQGLNSSGSSLGGILGLSHGVFCLNHPMLQGDLALLGLSHPVIRILCDV